MPDAFTLAPHLAVALGLLAGLGALRSWRMVCILAGAAILLQVFIWTALFLHWEIVEHGWTEDWQGTLGAGFLGGLIVAVPYTVIGAVAGGVVVGLIRRMRMERTT